MNTADPRWEQIKSLFDALLGRPAAEHDALIVAAALPADAEAELRTLLRHHAQATGAVGFLDTPAAPPAAALVRRAARTGQRLGAWAIVRALGEGGMGEVFEARRADGSFEGRAAVKLLKRGMDSAAVLQRFAQERQALARLNHPHIARLLDAGASEEGLPYFVMEYVDGRPIHEAALGLSLEHRLRLFLQLADAVAHAHRNLLVHRDLKPSNVLVDGDGQVKLLDFGIAKALDPLDAADGAQPGVTQAGERPYTPHYASPEQVRGEPVTTATDIYSLGVLLYQMLTGARPTGRHATTAAEAVKGVLEEQPTRPSRLSPQEALDPQWLATRKRLEGDLDNVLLKALEKTPESRYSHVDALAADVRAYLEGRPVSARAANPAYVLAKFARRHPFGVLAGGLGALGLAVGLSATLLQGQLAVGLGLLGLAAGLTLALAQARRAAAARDRGAQRLAETKALLGSLVRQHADAIAFLPGGPPTREAMLNDAAARLQALLLADPGDAELTAMLGGTLARLADLQGPGGPVSVVKHAQAERNARQALGLLSSLPAAHDPEVARWTDRTHSILARLAHERGQLDQAAAAFEQGLAVLRGALQRWPGHLELRRALAARLAMLGQLNQTVGLQSLGRPDVALRFMDEAAQLYEGLIAEARNRDDRLHLALLEGGRAVVRQVQDRLADALAHLQHAVAVVTELVEETQGEDTSLLHSLAVTLNNRGYVESRLGDEQASLLSAELAFRTLARLRHHDPANRGWRQRWAIFGQGWAHSLVVLGRGEEALPPLQEFEAVWREDLHSAAPGAMADIATRRLATNLGDQARVLHGRATAGAQARAQALAAEAAALAERLVVAHPQDRELLLYAAEVLAAAHEVQLPNPTQPSPAGQRGWRERAAAAYASAHALQPLQHDQLRAWQRLGGAPP